MDDEGAGADERPEAIAIIGMAGRFPKAKDVETLWANLCASIDGVTRFTPAELAELGRAAGLEIIVVVGDARDSDGLFDGTGHACCFGWNAKRLV